MKYGFPCSTAVKAWSTHAAVAHCRAQLPGSAVRPCDARRGDVLAHCHASGPRSDVAVCAPRAATATVQRSTWQCATGTAQFDPRSGSGALPRCITAWQCASSAQAWRARHGCMAVRHCHQNWHGAIGCVVWQCGTGQLALPLALSGTRSHACQWVMRAPRERTHDPAVRHGRMGRGAIGRDCACRSRATVALPRNRSCHCMPAALRLERTRHGPPGCIWHCVSSHGIVPINVSP